MKQVLKNTSQLSLAALALVLGLFSGCSPKKSSSSDDATTAPPTTSDIFSLVATGPSLTFNNQTGGVQSVALNPVTKRPAVAYYDKNSTASGSTAIGALKYAAMDATGAWTNEIIDANYGTAACGSVNSYCLGAPNTAAGSVAEIISLAFTTDGRPAIAYVYGASANTVNGYKQVRVAEVETNGRWKISVPFQSPTAVLATNVAIATTVDPIKAVTLRFDGNNNPHLVYTVYTQTITNSQIKYSFRGSSGNWVTSNISAAVTGAGTITALAQGNNQSGIAICPTTGPILTSRVVDGAGGAGKSLYIRCTALTADMCSTWSVVNLSTGCSGASCFSSGITTTSNSGIRTDLVLQPGTNKPILGIYSTATPANTLYTATLPSACDIAPPTAAGSYGAPASVGNTSQGLNGFSLAASSTETLISYLNSTTSVMANKCTTSSCSYFATGTTLETVTVASEGISAVYDSDSDVLYAGYARLPAAAAGAAGNDLIVASGAPAKIVASGSIPFQLTYVDTLSDFFPSTSVPTLSAARSAAGHIGFAYFYQDVTAADMRLYYGIRGGTANAPQFSSRFVISHQESTAGLFVGGHPALLFDSNNNPLIAYYNGVDKNLSVLRSKNGGISFVPTVIDDHTTDDYGQYPAVARFGNYIGISYYDATNTGLKFARTNGSGRWDIFPVDGLVGTGSCGNASADAGKYSSVGWTSTGQPVIAYQSDNYLRIAYAAEGPTSSTYTWTCVAVDSSGNTRGAGISMKISPTDIIHLAHLDQTDGQIRYITCPQNVLTCTTGAQFTADVVDAVGIVTTVKATPSLELNSQGTIYIAYYSASYQAMGLASRAAGATAWSKEFLDAAPDGTSFPSSGGQFPSLLLNDSGYPMIFYRSWENWLKYFSREVQ